MEKFLYFMEQTDGIFNADNDAYCVPTSKFRGFKANGTTTELEMHFESLLGIGADIAAVDKVILTITENKHKEVIEAISDKITFGTDPFVVVSDGSNSVFAHSDVTACVITVTAAA